MKLGLCEEPKKCTRYLLTIVGVIPTTIKDLFHVAVRQQALLHIDRNIWAPRLYSLMFTLTTLHRARFNLCKETHFTAHTTWSGFFWQCWSQRGSWLPVPELFNYFVQAQLPIRRGSVLHLLKRVPVQRSEPLDKVTLGQGLCEIGNNWIMKPFNVLLGFLFFSPPLFDLLHSH